MSQMNKSQKTINCDYCTVDKHVLVSGVDVEITIQSMLRCLKAFAYNKADTAFEESIDKIVEPGGPAEGLPLYDENYTISITETKTTSSVTLAAVTNVNYWKAAIYLSTNKSIHKSPLQKENKDATISFESLASNTEYFVRAWPVDDKGIRGPSVSKTITTLA